MYCVIPQINIKNRQEISFDDIISTFDNVEKNKRNIDGTGTVTYKSENSTLTTVKLSLFKICLHSWEERWNYLKERDRHSLYRSFQIPKKKGGLRKIDAPNEELSTALTELKNIINNYVPCLYHTSAFAYVGKHVVTDDKGMTHVVKGRCTVDCVKKHKNAESNYILKTDFSNFFGNSNKEFVIKMLKKIDPFAFIEEDDLKRIFDLCFLDDGLPQGTPISPMLTNIFMIPIDHALFNLFNEKNMVYTRYADDIYVSSVERVNPNMLIDDIKNTLSSFGAPYEIKPEKTRYVSRYGKNWMLGMMWNSENNITIGNKKKAYFKAMIHNLVMDYINHNQISLDNVKKIKGLMSYYNMIEPDFLRQTIAKLNEKIRPVYHCNVEYVLKNVGKDIA